MRRPVAAADAIRTQAQALGFDTLRLTPATLPPQIAARLDQFLRLGHHGSMGWMAETAARRQHPQAMWPDARTAIVLGTNYGPADNPLRALTRRDRGTISVYAQNNDYHDLIKKRLKALGRWMAATFDCELKVFVDTAPLMEKPLAAQSGLGWQGKHTNLVSRQWGSYLFLGVILTDMDLPLDAAESDHCGACRACLDICPTAAFPAPYQLDARRCISYLTIEHAAPIPRALRPAMGNRIYGCDDCLAVCPWNKFARQTEELAFQPRVELTAPRLADLVQLDDPAFRQVFAKSPIKRIGRDRFIRNVLIALGNAGDPALLAAVQPRLTDAAALVRGAAVWAASRLASPAAFAALRQRHMPAEPDPMVLDEWRAPEREPEEVREDPAAGRA